MIAILACGAPANQEVATDLPASPTPLPASPTASAPTPLPAETRIPTEITDEAGVVMVLVPAGSFTMGYPYTLWAEAECLFLKVDGECNGAWFTNETPDHVVYLDSFYIDQYEVSNAAYQDCVASSRCQPPESTKSATHSSYYGNPAYDNYPVINVTWEMARNYCSWRGARLPTEAEWEQAARGPAGFQYPWGDSFEGQYANFCDANCPYDPIVDFPPRYPNPNFEDGFGDVAPVDAYPDGVSAYQIYNLAGNVREWVWDWYDYEFYSRSPENNPTGPSQSKPILGGPVRSVRGGSWSDQGYILRATNRDSMPPDSYRNDLGFRCASTLK
jgi:formylglycine-generating enzyme required for sulfatase activity